MKKLINFIFDLQMFANNAANTVVHTTDATLGYEDTVNATNNIAYSNLAGNRGEWGSGQGLTPEMKTFYDKALIELVGPKLVHEQFGQKRPIPRNGGKEIEFRKFDTLPKALNPITEGVTPAGNKLSVNSLTAKVDQYGDYIQLTDMLELTAIDNVIVEATKKLADQAGRTMDTVVRNIINAGGVVQYCPTFASNTYTPVFSRNALDGTALLRVKDVFKAAAELKKQNAPTIGGSYVAIIHPYVAYDLMQEAGDQWVDITKYTQPENIMNGEIGKLGNVRFVESSEAFIAEPKLIGSGTFGTGADAKKLTFGNSATAAFSAKSGDKVYIKGKAYTLTANVTAGTDTYLTISETAPTLGTGETAFDVYKNLPVYSTLVLGSDAYGVTDIAGGGIEHIVKQKGYGDDPLNQRSSVGWKGLKTAAILVDQYMVRIESNSSMGSFLETN